jgi:hypothetical protein
MELYRLARSGFGSDFVAARLVRALEFTGQVDQADAVFQEYFCNRRARGPLSFELSSLSAQRRMSASPQQAESKFKLRPLDASVA